MHIMHDDREFDPDDTSRENDLAARIRALRKSLGMSQSSFARRVGVDQSNVSRWEHGAPPDDAHIAQLAEMAGQHPAAFRYGRIPGVGVAAPQPHSVVVVGYVGAGQEIQRLQAFGRPVSRLSCTVGESTSWLRRPPSNP